MYGDECRDLLRELAELESKKAGLHLKLYLLESSARNESIRLMGKVGLCELREQMSGGKGKARKLREKSLVFFRKYVRS